MSEKSFLLTLQSGKGWKTSLCRKEEKQDEVEWGNPYAVRTAGSNNTGMAECRVWVSTVNVHNAVLLFLSSWKQLCLKVPSSCWVVPHFPSLQFQRLWSWSQFAFRVNFQRVTLNLSASASVKLCCSAVLSLPDSSIACVSLVHGNLHQHKS